MIYILARKSMAISIIEYLNSYGEEITYNYSEPEYFDDREVVIFSVAGSDENLTIMSSYIKHRYSSSSAVPIRPIL